MKSRKLKLRIKGFVPVRRQKDLLNSVAVELYPQTNVNGLENLKILGYKLLPAIIEIKLS